MPVRNAHILMLINLCSQLSTKMLSLITDASSPIEDAEDADDFESQRLVKDTLRTTMSFLDQNQYEGGNRFGAVNLLRMVMSTLSYVLSEQIAIDTEHTAAPVNVIVDDRDEFSASMAVLTRAAQVYEATIAEDTELLRMFDNNNE